MKVATAQQMQDIDRKAIEDFGISGRTLMDNAGVMIASKVRELFTGQKAVVLAGGGNNGGDGIAAARELFNAGWDVRVLLLAAKNKLNPDCKAMIAEAEQTGVRVESGEKITAKGLRGAVVIDAIFGTGLNKAITGIMAKTIISLNNSDVPVVSADMPSGISADTGQIMGTAVKADYTITFGLPKRGHFLYPGAEYAGRLFVENIGFPKELLASGKLKVELTEKNNMSLLVSGRQRYSHKGDYGHVLVVAGSRGRTGAAFMAAKACMRAGAGLVTIGVPESLAGVFQARVTEEMVLPLPDKTDGTLSAKASKIILKFLSEKADVLCIGPGIGVSAETQKMMEEIVLSSTSPIVIDADGINSISHATGILKKAKTPIILTPHTGEMARLLQEANSKGQGARGKTLRALNSELMTEIEQDRIGTALSFSKETGTCLVLKGAPTIIAGPDGRVFINSTGNPGMATAGTGDVLTGMVSAFTGQGLAPVEAATLGVYMHGLAGDIAAKDKGEHSLIASDVIEALPAAFRELKG